MRRNIFLTYLLAVCFNAFFWMGIWLLYYLQFTNYAGVGVIETIYPIMSLVGEIPTGAIADLLGKKYTLILANFFHGLGIIFIGMAAHFSHLVLGMIVLSIGGILQSGAYEALIYDSLKQIKQEKRYDKILSNIQTISLVTMAISSIVGGFLYKRNHSLPYFLTGIFYFLGLILSFFLQEPAIDTEKFSWSNYLRQTKQGLHQLFQQSKRTTTLILLLIGAFFTILYESVGDSLVIEFGFRDQQLGIFYAVLFFISALGVQLAPWFKKHLGVRKTITFIGLVFSSTLMFSPFVYLVGGGITTYLRASLGQIMDNMTSVEINQGIASKYRATTLSTFSMLKLLPYALSAIFIGHLMDLFTARWFAFYFGLVFGIIILVQHFFLQSRTPTNYSHLDN